MSKRGQLLNLQRRCNKLLEEVSWLTATWPEREIRWLRVNVIRARSLLRKDASAISASRVSELQSQFRFWVSRLPEFDPEAIKVKKMAELNSQLRSWISRFS